jgi:hypothetical protein
LSDLQAKVRFRFRHFVLIALGIGAVLSSSSGRAGILDFSTFFGGAGSDWVGDVAIDGGGGILLLGISGSSNFPGLDASSLALGGKGQIYVARFDANGRARSWITPLGTPVANPATDSSLGLINGDRVLAFAVDATGAVYAAAYESSGAGGRTVGSKYLYKLDPGGHIVWAFPLAPAIRSVRAIAADTGGNAYVAGTALPGLATTAGVVYSTTNRTGSAVTPYLLKVDAAGQQALYQTYLSQSGQRAYSGNAQHPDFDGVTTPLAIAADGSGNVYVTGQAMSDFAATTGAPDYGDTQHLHTFIAKVNVGATGLLYVARMGGTSSDRGTSLVVTRDGSALVGGKAVMAGTFSLFPDFPVVAAPGGGIFQSYVQCVGSGCSAGADPNYGYLVKITPDGRLAFSGLVSSAGGNLPRFSGVVEEKPVRVALDAAENIWIAGTTYVERAFPLVSPFFPAASSGAFLMEVAGSGMTTLFATTFGSGSDQGVRGLAADGFGGVCLAGYTGDTTFPTLASLQGSLTGSNAFLAKVSDAAVPVTLGVAANPAASGAPLLLSVSVAASRDQGTVEFHDGATVLATSPIADGSASLTVSLAAGVHSLFAVYSGPGFFDGTSSPVVFEIVNNTGCP